MKKWITLLLITCLCLTGCTPNVTSARASEAMPDKIEIRYYYNQPCATCDDVGEFVDLFNEKLGDDKDRYPYELLTYNTFHEGDKDSFDKEMERLGVGSDILDSLTGPVLTMNGKAYFGTEEIGRSLREAYLTAGEDLFLLGRGVYDPLEEKTYAELLASYLIQENAAVCVYFHRIGCPECVELNADFMDGLPERITVGEKEYPLQIIKINTRSGRNGEVIRGFFEAYNVPEEDQMVPIVFTAKGYFAGYDAITANLLESLENGDGLNFTYPDQRQEDNF